MSYLVWLLPIALGMGLIGLMAFLWSLRDGQYDDLDGAAERVLLAGASDQPITAPPRDKPSAQGENVSNGDRADRVIIATKTGNPHSARRGHSHDR
ncbi:cbb3-type cytochrome oxidase assembly protein CcoS [Pseudohoeflea coraliihabitans]|uniref:Cbb3-type cytochrome oxidase assembly protein CcoS n=1 Tax=Pseudohoeflea coraliihabitans TaxID=2860393 RepID=A0ABS6WQR0_9HYPH|nr:cbb3-type cytochrome oxidase assembly protein CcoS [Pseudohoeflea sp. DP4N28-3]MBW3098304.1 cbb3-type cytochrome oxidase assembly protein CcoS [Pseudohoeflea sp. DP4N28-3]